MPIIERPKTSEAGAAMDIAARGRPADEAASGHMRPLIIFLLYTGARVGEALWLDWRNVDLPRAHVTFPKTKNGESAGRAAASARGGRAGQPEASRGRSVPPAGRPALHAPEGHRTTRRRAPHSHRRSRARAGELGSRASACTTVGTRGRPGTTRRNRDLGALQRLGGWKTLSMVMRYAHVNVAELQHTIDRLPAGGNLGEPGIGKAESA